MNKCNVVQALAGIFFIVVFFSCSSANNQSLLIDFSADSSAIEFNHIDKTGLLQLKNTADRDSVLGHLISVLQTPSERDTAIKEMPVQGTLKLTDSSIVFRPLTPFVKGSDYLIITHLNARFGDVEKLLKSELSYNVKPLQKLLTR